MPKKLILIIVALSLLIIVFVLRTQPVATPSTETNTTAQLSFDKTKYSTSSPSSLWVVVNKQRPLPSSYSPKMLRTPDVALRGGGEMLVRDEAATALEKMFAGAKQDGVDLTLVSGYRSFDYQRSVYQNFVSQDGETAANRYSAKPGHSEHQTGLAVDVGQANGKCQLEECFATTREGKWVSQNASRYGFIIRYKKNMESEVGFSFEPWHLRYVGPDLAQEIERTGQSMEAFFGLPPAPDYK